VIDGSRQHPRQLGAADACVEGGQLRLGLGDRGFVVLARAQFEEDRAVVDVARELLDGPELLLERRALAIDRLRLLLVVPEAGGERLLLERVDSGFQLRDVKGAPLAP
jgi:hypothetical protein